MPTPTYTPLANITLSAIALSVTFSSISQSYKDLVIVVQGAKAAAPNAAPRLVFNSDSGGNYYYVYMSGNGTTANSAYNGGASYIPLANLSWTTTIADSTVHIMDYSSTDKSKNTLTRTNRFDTNTDAFAGRWISTAAITSLTLSMSASGWATGTTFALYGIAA